jgi:hypothetical protein
MLSSGSAAADGPTAPIMPVNVNLWIMVSVLQSVLLVGCAAVCIASWVCCSLSC